MFDFAWSELALIAIIALVVIGPKDLPRVMRIVGQWVRRARSIAREFQGSLDQMMREAELDDIKRNMDRATDFNLEREIEKIVDPNRDIHNSLTDPMLTNPLTAETEAAATTPIEPVPSEIAPTPMVGEVAMPRPAIETARLPEPIEAPKPASETPETR
jgi:sec-independent protein translocase protein TatB